MEEAISRSVSFSLPLSPLCHSEQSLWTKSSLCVNVHTLALSSSYVDRQLCNKQSLLCVYIHKCVVLYLTGDGKGVAELSLASSKLSKHLCNSACLHTTCTWCNPYTSRPPSDMLKTNLPEVDPVPWSQW